MITFPAIRRLDASLLLRFLEVYETHRIDLTEAYLVGSADFAATEDIVSYDRGIDQDTTINHPFGHESGQRERRLPPRGPIVDNDPIHPLHPPETAPTRGDQAHRCSVTHRDRPIPHMSGE